MAGVEAAALRSDLKRTADAYASLARESRSNKALWEARETSLLSEMNRLKSSVRS